MKKLFLLSLIIIGNAFAVLSQTENYPVEFSSYKVRDISFSAFDNGILLTGYKTNNIDNLSFGYGIVKKLDVNANTIWEKYIGIVPPPALTQTFNLSQTSDGGYIVAGLYHDLVNNAEVFVMKLNACGEKEWQRTFNSSGSQGPHNIYELEDGSFLMEVSQWQIYDDPNKRIWVFKLAANGDVIWKKYYADYDPWPASGESVWEFIPDNNGDFVMSGSYYKSQPGQDTNIVYLRPFFLKIDTAGNEVWHNIMGISDFFLGDNFGADALNSGSIYAGCDARTPYDRSTLNKVYSNGQTAFKKDLNQEWGRAEDVSILADTAIYINLYTYDQETDSAENYVYHVDTLGNIVNTNLFNNSGTNFYVKNSTITKDNKYVLVAFEAIYPDPDYWKSYLWKFKPNLEYDSIYTQPQVYDTLCPYPITTDTIALDTTMVINLEHLWNELKPMSIFPNPVKNKLNIIINIVKWQQRQLVIRDINGREILNEYIAPGSANHQLDVSTFENGIYIISLFEKGKLLQTEKVVVSH